MRDTMLACSPSAYGQQGGALPVVVVILATLALVVASTPAVLLDLALAKASEGQFRLALPTGTVWNGEARLATSDGADSIAPLSGLAWEFEPAALITATLRWQVRIDDGPPARLEVGPRGAVIERLAMELPPAAALTPIRHAAARARWRGVLALNISHVACKLHQRCSGNLGAVWRAAGVDILPGVALGDYRVDVELSPQIAKLRVSTTRSQALTLDGQIDLPANARPQINLDLGGDAELLDRLNGMLAELRPVRDRERLRLRF